MTPPADKVDRDNWALYLAIMRARYPNGAARRYVERLRLVVLPPEQEAQCRWEALPDGDVLYATSAVLLRALEHLVSQPPLVYT